MWTDDQLKAIEAPVSDILVTAAAGSGKTAVMVERLIGRVIADEGVDIDKILVVTFTKAAASEIKERIAAKIAQKLSEGDNPRLKNQLVLINRASICTIHSFCLDIIKNNFHLLNLDPNFKVGDTTGIGILRSKALGDVLDKYYEAEDKDFLRLINSFTKKRDDAIEEIIGGIYDFARSTADPYGFLDECLNVYSGDCEKQLQFILDNAAKDADYAANCCEKALKLCSGDTAFDKTINILNDQLDLAKGILKRCDSGWDSVYDFIKDYKFATMRSNKNMDMDVFDEVKKLRDASKECLKAVIADKVNMSLSEIRADLLYMKPCMEMLCTLVKEFSEAFAEYKLSKNLVDFGDIEHLALKLLTNPEYSEVAEGQRARFEEIYIDEYQDCNGVQEALFKAVSRECQGKPNMFMVGDMKQCIYRFRNANPQLFKGKSDTYKLYGNGGDYNKILLSKNFRSRSEVLNCVNLIFSRIMSESVGELDYTDDEYLYNGASYEEANADTQYIDLCIIDSGAQSADDDITEKPAAVVAEAELVARKIRELVSSGYIIYDKSADIYRPVKYRDIAILLRGIRGSGDYFADALARYGINAFCDAGVGYFDCEEVGTLISFVKILANPLDDINLVSVMRSPVYNFTDNEILKIRTLDRKSYYYNSLLKYCGEKDALSSKCRTFLAKIDEYRDYAALAGADELLWHIIEDTGYMEFIGSLPNGAYKKANVRAFINSAHLFASQGGRDISAFSAYIDEMTLSGGDGQGAKLIGENDDVVRIMTIHKSKGLEFPVVFVSQCGKKFNTGDLSDAVLMHHELGLGIDYVDEDKRFAYKMTVKNAVRDKILEENLSEEMRLLYVALTRAREKLFITGVADSYDKVMEKVRWECSGADVKLHPRTVSACNNYLAWILRAVYNEDELHCMPIADGGFIRREITPLYKLASGEDTSSKDEREIEEKEAYSLYKGEILRRLTYEYPYSALNNLPRNVTVTEIKRIGDTADEDTYRIYRMPELKKPAFATDASPISTGRIGTLMHLCMEKIQLTDGINEATIKEEVELLVNNGGITLEEAQCIDIPAIAKFFESDIGKAMVSAKEVYREVPFEILVESGEIFSNIQSDEKIVVQGMIDAYFLDNDGNVILVDYKTDRRKGVPNEEFKNQIIERYRLQIYYYEKALTLLTGRSVCKKYIYLFDTGEAVEVR